MRRNNSIMGISGIDLGDPVQMVEVLFEVLRRMEAFQGLMTCSSHLPEDQLVYRQSQLRRYSLLLPQYRLVDLPRGLSGIWKMISYPLDPQHQLPDLHPPPRNFLILPWAKFLRLDLPLILSTSTCLQQRSRLLEQTVQMEVTCGRHHQMTGE